MKILMLSDSLALGGGAEKLTAHLGIELQKKGHEICHLTHFDSDTKYDHAGEYYSFKETLNKNIIGNAMDFFIKPFKIKKFCKKKGVDLIISMGERPNLRTILSKFLFRNKIKIIACHQLNPGIHLKNRIYTKEIKFLYPKANCVVCGSKAIEKILKNEFDVKNALTIYNMIDFNSCLNLSHQKLPAEYMSIFDKGFIFINVGRLTMQKGQMFLIRSFRHVINKYGDSKLCIIGDGELKPELVKIAKELDLEDKIFFLGTQKNMIQFIINSNCFVLSSLEEGFPLTLIETLTMNIPIISTDCKTGPRECLSPELDPLIEIEYPHFGKYGILSKPFSSDLSQSISNNSDESEKMLGHLMIKIIEDSNLRKKYSNGMNRALEFDKRFIMSQWEELINKCY
ncbi:MAG: glycosyltransferase [Methanobacterium sp.]